MLCEFIDAFRRSCQGRAITSDDAKRLAISWENNVSMGEVLKPLLEPVLGDVLPEHMQRCSVQSVALADHSCVSLLSTVKGLRLTLSRKDFTCQKSHMYTLSGHLRGNTCSFKPCCARHVRC